MINLKTIQIVSLMLYKELQIKKLRNFSPKNENEIKKVLISLRDIKARYIALEHTLVKVVKALKWNIIKDGKLLYNLEIMFYLWTTLRMQDM